MNFFSGLVWARGSCLYVYGCYHGNMAAGSHREDMRGWMEGLIAGGAIVHIKPSKNKQLSDKNIDSPSLTQIVGHGCIA